MFSKLLTLLLLLPITASAQTQPEATSSLLQGVGLALRANDYFMAKWSDPTAPTNFKKYRPSNLWTRGVYYEGLMAL